MKMRHLRRGSRRSWMLVLALGLAGCAGGQVVSPQPPPTKYLAVEYQRFVSGVGVDALANKYVRLRCRFSSMMRGRIPGGYSPARYVSFKAVAPTGPGSNSPEDVIIVVPKDRAASVFALRHLEHIQVEGRAVPAIVRRGQNVLFNGLVLEADAIQKQ